MKKKRFMKLLALASCVTLLTGCESEAFFGLGKYWNQFADWGSGLLEKLGLKDKEQKDEKESEDKPSGEGEQGGEQGGEEEQPKVPSLVVAELPEKLDVRASLDLDEYVTITNIDSYSVALADDSANLASLEGHVITTLGEGEVKFTVSAGELSQNCSVSVVSSVREYLQEKFTEAKNRYSVIEFDYDEVAQEYYQYDYFIHSSKYILTKHFSRDAEQNIVPGGWLTFGDDDFFSFTVQKNDQNQDEVVLGAQSAAVYMDVYNPEIEVDYYFEDDAVYSYDEEDDISMIVLNGEQATFFAQEAVMCYGGEVEGESTTYHVAQVAFYLEHYEDEDVLNYVIYVTDDADSTGKLLTYSYGEIWFGDDAGDALLDAYCVPENKPAATDYWEYFSKFGLSGLGLSDFVLSDESQYLPLKGSYSVEYGWFDDNGDPMAAPTSGTWSYFPEGSKLMFLSGTSIWNVEEVYDEQSGQLTDYKPSSGKIAVTSEGENPTTTIYDIYPQQTGYTALESDDANLWADDEFTFAGIRDRNNYAPGSIEKAEDVFVTVPAQNEGEDPTQEYDHTEFSFQQGKVTGLLDTLIAGDDDLYYVGAVIKALANQQGVNLYNYFGGKLSIDPAYGVFTLSLSFGVQNLGTWEVKFTSEYDSSAAAMADSWTQQMIENVINAA